MSDDGYGLFWMWRIGGSFFSIAIIIACIFACRCCTRKARRPVNNNALVLTTISQHDGRNYPMVFENGEWRPDRSGNSPFQNQPYQAGAPIPQNYHGPAMPSAPGYIPPPYPMAGEPAPPYSPPGENVPPPSYSVAIRGGHGIKGINGPEEGMPPGTAGVHSNRDPHSQQQQGRGDGRRKADKTSRM